MYDVVTLVEDAIQRPDEPRHFMVIKHLEHPVEAWRGSQRIARSVNSIRVQEVGHDIYAPVIYFPREDIHVQALQKSIKTTECPLKGTTEYFDVVLNGQVLENAAWSYCETYNFDERLEQLEGRIAFDSACVQVMELTVSKP